MKKKPKRKVYETNFFSVIPDGAAGEIELELRVSFTWQPGWPAGADNGMHPHPEDIKIIFLRPGLGEAKREDEMCPRTIELLLPELWQDIVETCVMEYHDHHPSREDVMVDRAD